MEQAILKPCPFCGDIKTVKYNGSDMVGCGDVFCPGYFLTSFPKDNISEKAAIKEWNKRSFHISITDQYNYHVGTAYYKEMDYSYVVQKCPFCGKTPIIHSEKIDNIKVSIISCPDENCRGYYTIQEFIVLISTKVKKWNQRL